MRDPGLPVPERHPDGLNVRVRISYRLEKFDGVPGPDAQPVEIVEGAETLEGDDHAAD